MKNRILVGVKDPDVSRSAVLWAAERAASRDLGLSLVHIVDEGIRRAGSQDLLQATGSAVERVLTASAELARSVASGVDISTDSVEGNPLTELVARSAEVDMVVVGSDASANGASRHGTRGFRIAAASTTPVAVIPGLDPRGRKGIVVGVDGSEGSRHAFAFAADEAERLGEELVAVYAWPNPVVYGYDLAFPVDYVEDLTETGHEAITRAIEWVSADHPSLNVRRVVSQGDPVTILNGEAANASLVVVGSHGRGAVARFLLGSVSHGVLARLGAPTVIAR
ncbi:universal stress protein [Mycetocola zhadangensis]|uniref:Universal stress protein n=1 Tax=Mycetocola zhadangensis TaxID=1164595 RepID=A0A3L7IVV2_9MICO|nr:universal stress protein [Mycetocola zhadangensis]RLQ81102.1 universal stress protein [Mycetocola zhadangensis]GGF04793.1 universal stress protein [Mycetocola zhadangensis]